jgi:hypothetical protein
MPMRMTAEKLSAKIYKTYRIYRKSLAPSRHTVS